MSPCAKPLSEERDGSEGRHQRVRANRPQHHAGGARQQGHRFRRGERPDQRRDARAPAEVRLGARQPEGEGRSAGRRHRRRRRCRSRWCRSAIPRSFRGRTSASTSCSNRRACSPIAMPAAKHITAGAKRVVITAPGEGTGHHGRDGRESREVRSGQAPDHLERVVHDELPRAGREDAAREVRHQEGLDDDRPRVHERPAAAGSAAQGSAARARGGAVDHSDDDRRGERRRRSAARAEGQARRHRDARAGAERVGRRSGRARRQEDQRATK